MVLDYADEIDLFNRLRRDNPDQCTRPIEIGEIVFVGGQKRVIYVGGIVGKQLFYSCGLDSLGHLESVREPLPMGAINHYRALN